MTPASPSSFANNVDTTTTTTTGGGGGGGGLLSRAFATTRSYVENCVSWTRKIASRTLIECVGCMIFHFVGSIDPTPYTNGIVLSTIVYYCAKISGAHLNPAASLTFALLGHIPPSQMLAYWGAQVTGCMMGAMWLKLLVPTDVIHYTDFNGCFKPNKFLSHGMIFGWESACTFTFLVPIFAVVWFSQDKSGYGNTGPIIVGMSLMSSAFAAAHWTGAALNPARALGSALVMKCKSNDVIWLYVAGELTAACLVPLAIIPWYGINADAWYLPYLPDRLQRLLCTRTMNRAVSTRAIVVEPISFPSTNTASNVTRCNSSKQRTRVSLEMV